MSKKLAWLMFALVTVTQAATTNADVSHVPLLTPEPHQAQAAYLAARVLTRYHYKAMPLDEAMSERVFKQYLKTLDSDKLFFLQSDIDELEGLRTRLGEGILKGDLSLPFQIFNRYAQRMSERYRHARRLLATDFDFTQQETYPYERAKEPWAPSEQAMNDLWRRRVKNDWLRLKLAGKDDKSIVETLDKRYQQSIKRIGQVKNKDAFDVFMNAYTMAIDPHTNYLSARAAEDFDISMSLSLVGIGAVLQEKDGFTVMREFVPGSPAALSGQLHPGDRILGVAQGENGTMTDVQGWRLDDVVALIRGKADSVVVLDVLPAELGPDGPHKTISLIRKKIAIEDQAAKKSLRSVFDGEKVRHVGVITLPSFYQDFGARLKDNANFRSATRDVARLLDELKKEHVDGVLIDLRDNGGGSLTEAIDLTGLFIGKGPVVQERDAKGTIAVETASPRGVAWDGPLEVLINRGSASASEIFAAAIQDYGRGVVVGETSFGKGTVQTVVSLDQIAKSAVPQFGELKMTIAQFFRINGGTTQLRGVTPDIPFPSVADPENSGESSFENALPWTTVSPAEYTPRGNLNHLLPRLLNRHEARLKNDPDFQFLQEDLAELERKRAMNQISLNENDRRAERDARERRLAARTSHTLPNDTRVTNNADKNIEPGKQIVPKDDGLESDERTFASEISEEKARKEARDIFLDEAVQILGDHVKLLKSGSGQKLSGKTKNDEAAIATLEEAL